MMRRNATRTDVQAAVDRLHELADDLLERARHYQIGGDQLAAAENGSTGQRILNVLATLEEQ